jgi:nucleoside-diphosphate-sugar epimerase
VRILITGGSGFIGWRVATRLAARGDGPVLFDVTGRRAAIPGAVDWPGGLGDPHSILRAVGETKPDSVVHAAAIVGVLTASGDPIAVLRVNLNGSINLFEAMVRHGVRRVIHLSSCEVYGDFDRLVVDETHPVNPLGAHGTCKLAVEQFGRTYARLPTLPDAEVEVGPGQLRVRPGRCHVTARHVGHRADS